MIPYTVSPYAHIIETRLVPDRISHRVFHQLTGEVFDLSKRLRSLFLSLNEVKRLSLTEEDLQNPKVENAQIRRLVEGEFLIPDGCDPLASFMDRYVVRPMQNPALAFRSAQGDMLLVRTSMAHYLFSPGKSELPTVIEERMSRVSAQVFLLADGSKTLREIFETLHVSRGAKISEEPGIRDAIEFLTSPERQLIKFTSRREDLSDPYTPVNAVPRSLYRSSVWKPQLSTDSSERIVDFHLHGIEDASWEFDWIETTINHAFRFPTEVLGGLDYGSRFCLSTLKPDVLPSLGNSDRLNVLEVGGGTGTFARSFIEQALDFKRTALEGIDVNYHMLELSPALVENQKKLLSKYLPAVTHFQQDATKFDLPGHKFGLIVANEVVADFPVAPVRRASANEPGDKKNDPPARKSRVWNGDGAYYVEKYDLPVDDAPDSFLVNAGVFRFIERSWEHLSPGGTLILSEYGGEHRHPAQLYNLNHDEFSIHFGHAIACARRVGFTCRLLALKEFLGMDDEVLMLNGDGEHLLCLNHIFEKFWMSLPYAAISKKDFEDRFQEVAEKIGLVGFSFSPLRMGTHFGPDENGFMVLIMNKPK
ncbi:MAG: SAM-dependent methyltransferase [Ignavibacteriae bacterium]|nr:SAM-dependent methyltransferase [Ignavibacteria bacterium]MBI3365666.1 SAM-dependent methyltransferase [Ignavibacteriota bacterium]